MENDINRPTHRRKYNKYIKLSLSDEAYLYYVTRKEYLKFSS